MNGVFGECEVLLIGGDGKLVTTVETWNATTLTPEVRLQVETQMSPEHLSINRSVLKTLDSVLERISHMCDLLEEIASE